MCTKTARPSCAIVSCWCPLTGEKRSFGNNPGQPNLSNLTFLPPPQPAPPSTIPKTLAAQAPRLPSPIPDTLVSGPAFVPKPMGAEGQAGDSRPQKVCL